MRAACAAVFRREGLRGAPPARGEGLLAADDPVPHRPRRHRSQLRRGARLPGSPRRPARRAADRRLGPGVDRPRRDRRGPHPRCLTQPTPDPQPSPDDRGEPLRRRLRGRAAGRGEGAGQRARLFGAGRVRPVGPPGSAAGAVEPLQHPPPPGRALPRLPALELDGARRLAVRRPGAPRAAVDLLRPRSGGLPPRRDAARGRPVFGTRATTPPTSGPSSRPSVTGPSAT